MNLAAGACHAQHCDSGWTVGGVITGIIILVIAAGIVSAVVRWRERR